MTATVTITSSNLTGTTVRLLCSSVTLGVKKNISNKPIENGTELAEIQTQSFNNPTYTINSLKITNATGTFSTINLLELMALKYSGTNAPTLTITYGYTDPVRGYSEQTLPHWTSSGIVTTAIPVILDTGNVNIDVKDSKEGYMPIGSLTFIQTK